jgi:molybdenum cofactor cytidylyltransferase
MSGQPKRPSGAATVVLAAGRSTRMGSENKLLLEIEPGVPVIRRTVEHALEAGLTPLYVVTGHEAAESARRAIRPRLPLRAQSGFADGLSGSIRAGFREGRIGRGLGRSGSARRHAVSFRRGDGSRA